MSSETNILTKKPSQKNMDVQLKSVVIDDEAYYQISNNDAMRPFFMSIVSDSNHWMFISSNGGLTAGRKNSEYALFPYYTDDKITESADITGNKSIFRIYKNNKEYALQSDPSSGGWKSSLGPEIKPWRPEIERQHPFL